MEPFAKKPRVQAPAGTSSNEVIALHLLKKNAQGEVVLEEDGQFPPDMTHQ